MVEQIRSDVRVAFTRSTLIAAMIELLRDRPAEQISVSELCKQAEISRPTFYQHFKSPDDVLAAAIEDRLAAITKAADATRPDRSNVPQIMARFLDALWRDRRLYRAALQTRSPYGSSRGVMETWLRRALGDYFGPKIWADVPTDFDQRMLFAVGGIITVVAQLLGTRGLTRPDFTALSDSLWASVVRAVGADTVDRA